MFDVRPFGNYKYNIKLVYFVSYNFSIFFSHLNELRTMVHRCKYPPVQQPFAEYARVVPRNNRTVSVVRHQVVATAAIDTVALSAICTRTVWSVKAYNNYYLHCKFYNIIHVYVFITFIIFVCVCGIKMYIIFFISYVVLRVLSVPAVGFVPLQAYAGCRPTSTYDSIRLRL